MTHEYRTQNDTQNMYHNIKNRRYSNDNNNKKKRFPQKKEKMDVTINTTTKKVKDKPMDNKTNHESPNFKGQLLIIS